MKRLFIIAILSVFYLSVGRSEGQLMNYTTLIRKQLVSDYLTSIDRLIHAVREVESNYNDYAVGKAHDTGPLQITPIRLQDYNQQTDSKYTLQDCFNFEVSKKIFLFYAERIGASQYHWEKIARRWNRSSNWQDEKGAQYWILICKQLNKTKNVQDFN